MPTSNNVHKQRQHYNKEVKKENKISNVTIT